MTDALKDRLIKMRDKKIATIVWRGKLPQLEAISAVLAALDELPTDAQLASRAVVSDDGETIRLTLYGETGAMASVELHPIRAITPLIDAAVPKLA
jgi:hypothetical protein